MARPCMDGPLGPMTLYEAGGALTRLNWGAEPGEGSPILAEAARQPAGYFEGTLRSFDLPFDRGNG
jgi:hypothetical protein